MIAISIKPAKCKDCYKCIRLCKVKAIKMVNDRARLSGGDCIECGQCLEACPQNAIVCQEDLRRIRQMIADGETTVVSLAPAYLGVFGDASPGQMASALRRLGFTYVHETAEAAPYLTESYIQRSDRSGENDVILTSACSAINNLIEKYHPEMLPYLAPTVTPAIAHGRMLREKYGSDVKIIYISPCVADSGDALRDRRTRGVIDAVLDFAALRDWLRSEKILIPECPEGSMDNADLKVDRLYAVSGGILSSIKADKKHRCRHKRLYLSGIGPCEELFDCIRRGEISNCVVELSACVGGCLNGPLTGGKKSDRFRRKIALSQKVSEHVTPDYPPLSEAVDLSKTYEPRRRQPKMPSEEELHAILSMTGKDRPEKELNCGACGFPTCRAKAAAVFQGRSELSMCIPYMYEQARGTTETILSMTPNMIIVVNRDCLIREFNHTAEALFGVARDKVMNRPISAVMPDDLFAWVISHHENILERRVDYEDLGLYTMQSIIYMPEQKRALAIIRNITDQVRHQQQLQQVKLETVAMAQNVISRQMMVAQEIAGLLGETTAETKSTLNRLKDTLLNDVEETGL